MSTSGEAPDWFLSGIQQIGVGVADVKAAFAWARKAFGMDVPIFDDAGDAPFMTRYTGDKVQSRHAILAANLHGGSAFELWQFTSRQPTPLPAPPEPGDYGIFCPRIKSPNVETAHASMKSAGIDLLGEVARDPGGSEHFFVRDPQGLTYQVVADDHWFSEGRFATGGVAGCMIGVSDIERSRGLYSDVLGYDRVVYDATGTFADFAPLPSGTGSFRRVLLAHEEERPGAFGRLLGPSKIELVQALERTPRRLFEGRYWGDIGFIQVCFDIHGMDALRRLFEERGYAITADSADSFDMGEAAGHFCYIEDPDGTLIELVETHRIPILKKIGWYLDLRRRDPRKPLPSWMIKALGLGRVKD